jgi:cytochrome c
LLKKFIAVILGLTIVGVAVFWLVTKPAKVYALPAYSPNIENGRMMFYASGCAMCHASAGQGDLTRLDGGTEL